MFQIINQTMLSNRRSYSDLFVRLMSSDIEREKTQYNHWKRRVEDWKHLKTNIAIQGFRYGIQGSPKGFYDGAAHLLNCCAP